MLKRIASLYNTPASLIGSTIASPDYLKLATLMRNDSTLAEEVMEFGNDVLANKGRKPSMKEIVEGVPRLQENMPSTNMANIGETIANNPYVAAPISTVVGIGGNAILGNPIGGVIDMVTGNAMNLKPDPEPTAPQVDSDVAEKTKVIAQQYQRDTGRPLNREQYMEIMTRLQQRKVQAIERMNQAEIQQRAMSQYQNQGGY